MALSLAEPWMCSVPKHADRLAIGDDGQDVERCLGQPHLPRPVEMPLDRATHLWRRHQSQLVSVPLHRKPQWWIR